VSLFAQTEEAVVGRVLQKTLSRNDVGATGGHQAGILIPKSVVALHVFPALDREQKNPRAVLEGFDEEGKPWKLNYIYYNSRLFGGTRDEFRLTGISRFLKAGDARVGDGLQFEERGDGTYWLRIVQQGRDVQEAAHAEQTPVEKAPVSPPEAAPAADNGLSPEELEFLRHALEGTEWSIT